VEIRMRRSCLTFAVAAVALAWTLAPAVRACVDTDGDGVCDVDDDCPLVANPAQADADVDGLGDACDPCTNVFDSTADRSQVVIGGLGAPVGDETLVVRGRFIPFLETPLIDPVAHGLRVRMETVAGDAVFDALIPGGAYDHATRAGWTSHAFPTGMTAEYRNPGTIIPQVEGLAKIKFVLRTGVGITKFTAKGRGAYPVAAGQAPVRVIVVVDAPYATTGQCGEMTFPGDGAPACAFTADGAKLVCK
jgi:hypothetical protein